MAENLLDIVTKVARPKIKIDGAAYELKHPKELSLVEQNRFNRMSQDLQKLGEAYRNDPEKTAGKLEKKNAEILVFLIPDLPEEVVAKLNVHHTFEVIQAFMGLTPGGAKQVSRKKMPRKKAAKRGRRKL